MYFLNESLILKQISEGDEKAFSEIYANYKPDLYRLVYKILKSSDVTNDTCQEVFIKIWEDRQKLTEVHSFKSYLLVAGKNHSLNVLKKVLSEEKRLSGFVQNYSDAHNGIEDKVQSDEYQSFLQSILATLTPQSKKVFQLCRQQGMSYDEAAENMGVSRSLIKKHMVRSMKIMRLAVERDLGIAFGFVLSTFFDFAEMDLLMIFA
ncbi:RNA polymerase sigma factor [Dyadobacter frigoris]|uniref:Sigma-70 family RNA polymerase sigma factor n=1 Tax=Dyadobacter frigoris TaxID=2576211 RepID=A0A4U6D4E6_9BACT|nr:sigma-70 family RNA polymerase sigma factor [Dyadobacter frigoris]TKT88844.1 sigma-70 family RNA polymerase sigma factor [Dyadobacter frigoris]GLU56033.1 DNA-directed RNA polymerase sigma-70 factor [Dyadobacter frigoris]